jgi:hypothetical protein
VAILFAIFPAIGADSAGLITIEVPVNDRLFRLAQGKAFGAAPCLLSLALVFSGCGSGSPGRDGVGGSAGVGTTGAGGTSAGGTTGTGGATGSGGSGSGGSGSGGTTGGAGTTGAGGIVGTGGATGMAGATGTGGMCSGVTGASFPAITDYTARDGGFGPAVVTRNTGDATLGTDKVAVFRPAAAKYGQGGVTHPILVWGNGHTNTVDGFVVVAPEQTEVTAAQMNAAIDYALRLASDPTSGDCGKIDTTKIGSTGYSLGGMGAISVGSDARITSTFVFASNGNVKSLKAPWGVIGGDADTTFNWTSISAAVTGSTQSAFGAALVGIDHNGVAGQPKSQQAYIAWMRWRFMGDQAGHDMFVGANCTICTDAAFSAFVKTATFDSL